MNTETIISDLGKDLIRVHGALFNAQEKHFLLHYEEISAQVFSSKDEKLENCYIQARGFMNHLVTIHLRKITNAELFRKAGSPITPSVLLDADKLSKFQVYHRGMVNRMKALNLL